ncbi:hypothetical protein NVP1187O_086 [Vibrio phage 1.187.O._10N.286.49.F1]|nr:hypothetical protein NVP1187O_086 [Vibrio phage 1.187.O._10N.286.49.F1]
MIILKELSKIKSSLEHQTALRVDSLSVDIEDGDLTVWVTLYDWREDMSYTVSTKEPINILLQFQNERILKSLVNRLINAWVTTSSGMVTVH